MFRPIASALAFLLLALSSLCLAQDGVSTAGAARARYLGNLGIMPASREVTVEDFVNYHRHEIGRPKAGEAVGLDLRWGNDVVSGGKDAVLQIGLSTALAHDRQELRPLNLALVIDKSGSMSADDKLVRVKSALLTLVSQLRPTDVLSIVVFDSEAEVLLPAQKVVDPNEIKSIIRSIEPGSATNLHAGLMLGYREAMKHFRKESTNRVILLTDGIANQGVVEPEKIAVASQSYNDRGIDLSTIGVGLDLNKDLLRDLAKSGRGLFHFVSDSEDIEKVFVKELQSLISPVASEPNLKIELDPGLVLEKVYGYEPRISENSVKIKLDNMNSGMTEVVLLRVRPGSEIEKSQLPVKVTLSYFDLARNKQVVATQRALLTLKDGSHEMLEDGSVAKNFTIALLAQSIRDMAADCEEHNYREAEAVLNTAVAKTNRRYPNLDDEDIKRTLTIAQKYRDVLRKENHSDGREDIGEEPTDYGWDNLIVNGDFAQGIRHFAVPALDYSDPVDNCLWSHGYTIAPSFNSPLLHHLVAAQPFPAPKRSGNAQVFFANIGGTDSLVVLTTTVKCKPNTRYRISFQTISLTPGREWIPTFEIRVNGTRSEPKPAADGVYAEVATKWNSSGSSTATISIVRMPIPHGGGIVGIANIEMVSLD